MMRGQTEQKARSVFVMVQLGLNELEIHRIQALNFCHHDRFNLIMMEAPYTICLKDD